jgi:Ca2+-binding EF-hand superfamily protein
LSAWRKLFDRFDIDRSDTISLDEFQEALVSFGYRLSAQFVRSLFKAHDPRGRNAMPFDLFIQACISLKRMTDIFKKYDEDRDGYVTLSL